MQRSAKSHRTYGTVGRDHQTALSRQRSDLLPDRQAAAVGQIHLHDVARPQGGQPAELLQHVKPLAGRDGKGERWLHVRKRSSCGALQVPRTTQGGKASDAGPSRWRSLPKAGRGPRSSAQPRRRPPREPRRPAPRPRSFLPPSSPAMPLQTDRTSAPCIRPTRPRGLCWRTPRENRRRHTNRWRTPESLASLAAQQLVHRFTARFANQVPQAISTPLIAVRMVGPPWYWSRIRSLITLRDRRDGAQDSIFDPVVDQRLNGLLLPFERRLAETGQSGIGRQAHKEIVAQPGIGQKCFQARNFHSESDLIAVSIRGHRSERKWTTLGRLRRRPLKL